MEIDGKLSLPMDCRLANYQSAGQVEGMIIQFPLKLELKVDKPTALIRLGSSVNSPVPKLLHHFRDFYKYLIFEEFRLQILIFLVYLWIPVCMAQNLSTIGILLLPFPLSYSSSSSNIIQVQCLGFVCGKNYWTTQFLFVSELVKFPTCPASPHCCLRLELISPCVGKTSLSVEILLYHFHFPISVACPHV